MEYEEYERAAKKQEKINDDLLDEFSHSLLALGLTKKTANTHCQHLDFFINYYLLYTGVIQPENAISEIDEYFSDYFPRKAMWSDAKTVTATCAALKKFYLFLFETSRINDVDLASLNALIKEKKTEWISYSEPLDDDDDDDYW